MFEAASTNDGHVDKVSYNNGKILDYKLSAVGSGKDALEEVVSRKGINGQVISMLLLLIGMPINNSCSNEEQAK